MPAKLILKLVGGAEPGKEFVFAERTTSIIGRGEECYPRIPNNEDHRNVSRTHCLLDINPPDVCIRDFGSRNGTYVNGVRIGRRKKDESREKGMQTAFPEHDLKDGDEVRVGKTRFKVAIQVPSTCITCGQEATDDEADRARQAGDSYQCASCRPKVETAHKFKTTPSASRSCTQCGADVSVEMGENRQGEFVCNACKGNALSLVNALLDSAQLDDKRREAIGGYTVVRKLGEGGMGAVFLAKEKRTGQEVALKIMLPQVALDAQGKFMFLREADNTRSLKHPNIVELLEAGCSRGIFFLTMEYCDGGSVQDLLKEQGGTLPLDEAGPLILEVLDGLDYAHRATIPSVRRSDGTFGTGRGLIHRDLKPANIYLNGTGKSRVAKVGDFGLSKAFDQAGLSGHTCTGSNMGTPAFMPRVQVYNFKYAQPDVDVWASMATFYYMLTRALPRDFPRGEDPYYIVLTKEPVPIRQRNGAIPRKLAEVIDFALQEERGKPMHFASAAELKKALVDVL